MYLKPSAAVGKKVKAPSTSGSIHQSSSVPHLSKNILVSNPTLDGRSDEETLHRWIDDPEDKPLIKGPHVRQISGMSDLASIKAVSIEKRAALRNLKPE